MGTLDDHEGPWSETDYLALGETHHRIELLDGSLLVTPSPNDHHQEIMGNLRDSLRPAARTADLRAPQAPNIRLATGRILIPDLAVKKGPTGAAVSDAADVVLVCEITSPSNTKIDRGLKMLAYAAAGIPWYLLAEPDFTDYPSVSLRLFRLADGAYIEHAVAKHGEKLTSQEPFAMSIDTTFLLDY
ncbi:Uma2 family endonuclease [Actinoplanes subglobosus]|uniref:Uma2 family endonuclease n=1 Tax=Actinoplanes subglobosus TaxID=1547892 RepID=A0ABV8JAQ7_9ACTN